MANMGTASSEFVKLIAYIDELEGGPPPVTLTIQAKPRWRIHRIQPALMKEYERHLVKNYPEFAGAYTVTQYDAFPPKTQFDETDHVSDILEKPKGLLGPHIHILATVEEIEKTEQAATASKTSSPGAETNDGPRKRVLNDSAVENLRKKSSTQKEHNVPLSSGTLKRPTKAPSVGGSSSKRKDAPRRDLYEIADDSEVETSYEDDLFKNGPNPKRARTDAGPSREAHTPGQQIPSATPTSAQPRPPTVQSTPVIASSSKASNSVNPVETGLARAVWTDWENELMLAEIIENGTGTPTAILKETLFPGRTTEGIRKRRTKMQNDQAQEILQGRRDLGLQMVKAPAGSKAAAKSKGSMLKPATSSKTPSKPKAHAVSGTLAISKTPWKSKTPIKFKTPARTKTPARLKSATPRSVPYTRKDSSPVVLIEALDDPSQTQLEVRPDGAVRVKTPKSSPPTPLETASTSSREPFPTGTTASARPVPVSSENTPSHDSGFDELVAEEEQRQDSIEWLPSNNSKPKTPRSYSKFLQDARASMAANESAAKSQLHPNLQHGTLQPSELVSSIPIIPSLPSPNFTTTDFVQPGPTKLIAPKKRSGAATPDDPISSSPEKIRSPSPETAACWIEVERSSSKAARPSPGWPEDTPIAVSAIANAEAREAVLTARVGSVAVQSSPIKHQGDHSRNTRHQSIETDDTEDFDTRESGQTPRTLDFKARTPRSLTRSIASRRLPFKKRDASSEESESDSSDEDDNDSSTVESDGDIDVNEKPEIDANIEVDVDMDAGSGSGSSDDEIDSSPEEHDVGIDVAAKTQADVTPKVATNVEVEATEDVAHTGSDSSDSSSDDDSSDGENDADIKIGAKSKVGAEIPGPEVDMNVDGDSNSDSSDEDDSDSSADESDADLKVDAGTGTQINAKFEADATYAVEAKPKVDIHVEADMNKDSESDSDASDNESDSNDSSDSESDDTEVGVRRNVSKALGALVDIKANSAVSTISRQESEADSSSSDESSEDADDEEDVSLDITGSEADALADQQLRSDAEQSQKSHDDVFTSDRLSHEITAIKQGRQERVRETSHHSDNDINSDSIAARSFEKQRDSEDNENDDEKDDIRSAPITIVQPVNQKRTSHPQPKARTKVVVHPKRSLKKNKMTPAPTIKIQAQAKPAQKVKKIIKAKKITKAESSEENATTPAPTTKIQPQAKPAYKANGTRVHDILGEQIERKLSELLGK